MDPLNLSDIKETFQKYESLSDLIMKRLEVIWDVAQKEYKFKIYEGKPDEFEFSEDYKNIHVTWYDTWPYGGWDRGTVLLPTNLLWDDYVPYFEDYKRTLEEYQKREQKIKKKKTEESQRKTYEELKKKFEK